MDSFLQDNWILSVVMIICSLLFLLFTVYQIKRGKLLLRYSLMWMLLSVLILIVAIFPQPVFHLAALLGFNIGSNFIFAIAIFFLLIACMAQSRVISQQVVKNKDAVQRIALLEKRIDDIEKDL